MVQSALEEAEAGPVAEAVSVKAEAVSGGAEAAPKEAGATLADA